MSKIRECPSLKSFVKQTQWSTELLLCFDLNFVTQSMREGCMKHVWYTTQPIERTLVNIELVIRKLPGDKPTEQECAT